MSRQPEESREDFEILRQKARDEVNQGNFEVALALCDHTIRWAERYGDQDTQDQELCNRSSILVNQGLGSDTISKLRQILLRSSNPEICHQAAGNISRFHEMRQESQRGRFYAQLSLDHAKKTAEPIVIARSYNQLGLLLVRDSYFTEATDVFRKALAQLDSETNRERATILCNLGYCLTMEGDLRPGFSLLFESLRVLKRFGTDFLELYPRIGLSFAYLEIDRPDRACFHARKGLALAELSQMTWQIKNALYLLGESEKLCGNEFAAHRTFTRLQQEFYPDDPVIPDFLMATDVRKLVNLMA